MTKFRKKPVVIDAWLIKGGESDGELAQAVVDGKLKYNEDGSVLIDTLEGTMQGFVGDWIIRGINGELYPCKPDIFAKTYESPDAPVAGGSCFLLEDDPPEDHGKPIACTQCWNALSEMERAAASKAARLSDAVDEYQSLVDYFFTSEHPMPKEQTTAHRIASMVEQIRSTNSKCCAGRLITVDDVAEVLRSLVWSIRSEDGASPELLKAHEMLHNVGKTVACVPVTPAS